MKKFFMTLVLVMMCVMSVNAKTVVGCVVVRNNGSTVTVTFDMARYYDIPSEDIPYAQYLRPWKPLLTEVGRLIPERFRYNAQYYSPWEAGQEMAMEMAKFKRLKVIVANLNAPNGAKVDTVSRQQVKEDAHKAAQQYAAKRAANGQTQQATPQPQQRQDSTQNSTNTQGTSGFATGW